MHLLEKQASANLLKEARMQMLANRVELVLVFMSFAVYIVVASGLGQFTFDDVGQDHQRFILYVVCVCVCVCVCECVSLLSVYFVELVCIRVIC